MKNAPRHHHSSGSKKVRVPISDKIAQKLAKISDDEVVVIDSTTSLREWHGEADLQRYAIGYKNDKYFLVPVGANHEGKTLVFIQENALNTQTKTRRKFRNILPALGIAAFLSLDAYLAYKFFKKSDDVGVTDKVPAPEIQKIAPKISTVAEILNQNHITLDDFLLNNPGMPLADSHSFSSLLEQRISLASHLVTTPASVPDVKNPLTSLLGTGKKLGELLQNPLLQKSMDQYYTMLESMISFECAQKDGNIPKDMIGGSDVHKGEQYAGINMNSAKSSNNQEKLEHAQEIAQCYARGDQKKLRDLVKAYYLLYYFPAIQSRDAAINAFLFDTSMNRGADSIQPICKMVINAMTDRDYVYSQGSKNAIDKEGKPFERHIWNKEWTSEHQKIWDVLCTRFPHEVMQHLRDARRIYEDGTYGQRISIRPALEKRWNRAQESAEEMFLPATYRTISYHDSVAMIEKSLTEQVPTHDVTGKPIIYRVQRIQDPTKEQAKAEEIYKHTIKQPRPKKEIVLFHGTASGIVGIADIRTRDLGGFNAIYKSSAAAYVITSKGLIFEFFDPTKGHGAANATRIAESTGVPKEDFNFNGGCIGVEMCLRGYKGGPFSETILAQYGVEPPSDEQKRAAKALGIYLKKHLDIKHIGTSADPVRDHTKCYDNNGCILIGPKYLVPEAHCDDFSAEEREKMGIESAEDMAKIFGNKGKLSALFEFDIPAQKKLTSQ